MNKKDKRKLRYTKVMIILRKAVTIIKITKK